MLLGLVQSDRERECIKYAVYKSSGISATKARCPYGMNRHAVRVEQAISEVQQINEMVDEIANMKDKAALATFGITECTSESSDDTDDCAPGITCVRPAVMNLCKQSLIECKYNWFCLMDMLEDQSQVDDVHSILESFFLVLPSLGFSPEQIGLIRQSTKAYNSSKIDARELKKAERVEEELIVTETEFDDLQKLAGLRDPLSECGRILISKRRKAIQRQKR